MVSDERPCAACGATIPADRSVCPACGVLAAAQPVAAPAPPPPPGSAPPTAPSYWSAPGRQGPGFAPPPMGVPLPSAPPPRRKQRGWVGMAVALVALAAISLALVLSLQGSDGDDGDGEAASKGPTSTVTAPPTTTIPRVTQVGNLQAYCNAPGLKWPEVPPHVPGEPDRAYTRVMELGLDNASDTSSYITARSPVSLGGSTVISPTTDNAFTDDPSVLIRTRSVACVTFIGTEDAGVPCTYTQGIVGQASARAARNRFAITVYELHSGGILHKGEIVTRASGCPEWAVTEEGDGLVAYGITDQDVLAWFDSHFVDGKPA